MLPYFENLFIIIILYTLVGGSGAFILSFSGEFCLSLVAAYAIGAYTGIFFAQSVTHEILFIVSYAGAAGFLFGSLTMAMVLRLRDDDLALGTLAIYFVVIELIKNVENITGGVRGIGGVESTKLEFMTIGFFHGHLALAALMAVIISWYSIGRVFLGKKERILKAQSENPQALMAQGVNFFPAKGLLMMLASSICSIAGSIYALHLTYISPQSFEVQEVTIILLVTILSVKKPFFHSGIVAAGIVCIPEMLKYININPEYLGPFRQFLFGAALYFVVLRKKDRFPITKSSV
jgi:branched-chain amino acid transport system permease protein